MAPDLSLPKMSYIRHREPTASGQSRVSRIYRPSRLALAAAPASGAAASTTCLGGRPLAVHLQRSIRRYFDLLRNLAQPPLKPRSAQGKTADGSPANRFAPSRTSDNSCQACRASTPIGIPVGLIVRSTPPELVQPSHRRLHTFTPSVSARLVLSFLGRRARPFSHPKVFANRPHSSFQTPHSLSLGFAHPPATAATAILPWRTSTSRRLPNCTDPFKHLLSRPIRL